MFSRIVLALALLASSATAFQANFPKLGGAKAAKKIEVPEEEKPLTERLGGVGVTAPFDEGFDPFGFASRADAAQMIKFREVSSVSVHPFPVLVPSPVFCYLRTRVRGEGTFAEYRALLRSPTHHPRTHPSASPLSVPLRLCAGGA